MVTLSHAGVVELADTRDLKSLASACGFEPRHRHHVVADFVSFAAAFSFSKQTPPLTHAIAPPLQLRPVSLGSQLVFYLQRQVSFLSTLPTSSRTLYRSRRRFLFQSKRHLSLTPSLLLSNCDPLRWARSWFPSGKNEYAPDRFPVGHVFIVLEWFSISPLSPPTAALRPGSARPWR